MLVSRTHVLVAAIALAFISATACVNADAELSVGDDCDSSFCRPDATPPFTPPAEAGAEASSAPRALCVATECPYPHATCDAPYKCSIDLSSNDDNCGSCGVVCEGEVYFGYLHVTSHCVGGVCRKACTYGHADCNGVPDDGCEVDIVDDRMNCGACGTACAPDVACFEGRCGCLAGQILCGGSCRDPRSLERDPDNCGTCGNRCDDLGLPPIPAELHMVYTCSGGQCGQKICDERWGDCDGDSANGCERVISGDRNNCGGCDVKCDDNQICSGMACLCPSGETYCGPRLCANLAIDRDHCGACNRACPETVNHARPLCRNGECGFECDSNWADCDGDPENGCEADLLFSPEHCGACGNRCETDAGQPCLGGRCLMTECGVEVPQ